MREIGCVNPPPPPKAARARDHATEGSHFFVKSQFTVEMCPHHVLRFRFVAAVMIWTSLVLSVALLTLSCVYCYFKYDSLKSDPESQASITEIGTRSCGCWLKKLNKPRVRLFIFSGFTTDLSAYTELANFWLTFFIISVIALVIILLILIFLRKRFANKTTFLKAPSKPRILQTSDRHRADRGGLDRRGRHHVNPLLSCRPFPTAARRHRLLRRRRHVSGFIWGTQIRFAG